MILEIAKIEIKAGKEDKFEAAMAAAVPLFQRAQGCHGVAIRRSVETPSQYWLMIRWETMEHHTKVFAVSPDFHTFVGLVGDCFAAPPRVDHADETWAGF